MDKIGDKIMRCYFCDKELALGKKKGFICVCDKCLDIAEKSEARMVEKICQLRKMLSGANACKEIG